MCFFSSKPIAYKINDRELVVLAFINAVIRVNNGETYVKISDKDFQKLDYIANCPAVRELITKYNKKNSGR
jgi:hypothetical protein